MSIKGTSQELYVGKEESNIISLWGSKKRIDYDDLKRIDYMFATYSELGYINFVHNSNKTDRFKFRKKANEKILRTVELIKENNEEINLIEKRVDDLKFYERWWFIILSMFLCCAPIGLFLLWYKKKSTLSNRIFFTIMALIFWGASSYVPYINYKASVNQLSEAMSGYQNAVKTLDSNVETNSIQSPNQETEETSTASNTVFEVGDIYESDSIKIMFLNCGDYSVDNQFMQPESGNKYIFAEFSIENVGKSDLSTGSYLFDCYAGNTECKQPIISGEDMLTSITSISSGKNTKGKIFFEVPTDAEEIQLEYKIDVLSDEKIYFNIK